MSDRPRLTPAVADLRRAVRGSLLGRVQKGDRILVALSGGPDSLALAAATAFEAKRLEVEAGAVIIDHDLQEGSARVAERAAEQAAELGLAPVSVVRVSVEDVGAGPEASARVARYEAIEAVRVETGAPWVLLGHTLDDQAETVLLGLARGSGAKSLHGMAPVTGALLRPLLGIHRAVTVQACEDQGLSPWIDPHNSDPAYTRVRVRDTVLPLLEKELGPGISEALARTATTLREDSETLDALALEWAHEIVNTDADGRISLDVGGIVAQPPALRQRICRIVAEQGFGVSLTRGHTMAVTALATEWRGQGPVDLPGIRVEREKGRILFGATASAHDDHLDETA
ncbi:MULTISPECIES: tRNA lysidine(34) synthetase TilS [unclassified Pseudoclavibacter]|uniref:tRNA lysidine(34) synthetase TilS n=1 Tax=unclassified Pseudoclavibacter TaxID=2615177 RepID=UPI000CE8CB98|nr:MULTISPECIES: tRNA lysidine(34) synthetase TilS [unclassified Pseudoclavibacter]MBF4457303.1 tRNA lysidine(34) synthetase TilS [Pseudoclavibacter sp. VKM Ac-2867]MBF4550402.1 tRNA lysidine(34) synthetase TilS [Pseudoclavibacter sp. VKM Ac-2888]PPF34341.1 tRNA lysidine(34) synthetase TilS [Pseudoclavibacter sp. AY1H1]PPF77736.1 tRNA lysidine(34) synthetase TilS [Pseudoclavibacter sp. Z016]PPG05159.1 tRNA lysidine(34) synthetase TilS [Pseudoclavibacter sp. RFBI5]